jgi:hypothetical protein
VESNRPISNNPSKPSSGGSSNSGGTSTSGGSGGSGATQPTHSATYTGSEVKEKLYGLGFVDLNGGLTLNQYGAKGAINFTKMDFSVLSNKYDMNLTILQSDPETDQKIKTILNWILPSQGNHLYSILDTSGLQSQTLELEGRTVNIRVQNYGIAIDFGPIK